MTNVNLDLAQLRVVLPALLVATAFGLSSCASLESDPVRAGAASVAAPKAKPPNRLRPFERVVKGATRVDGLFTLWRKDEKVWLELRPADFEQPFFLSPKIKTGIGEGHYFGGLMSRDAGVVQFRRVNKVVQMIWRNMEFTADAGTPEGYAVAAAFSPSLLSSATVLSRPHPERKSVLVEANALFVSDLLAIGAKLQRQYRQGYKFDARNSAITSVRATPELVVLEVLSHFKTNAIAVPKPGAPSKVPKPTIPRTLPDARSMFMTLHYSLAKLPAQPMRPRNADARVGHFNSSVVDFSDDLERNARRYYINRWRLEKQDPSAERSAPIKPITFWLDKTIPHKYRAAITSGVLEWNKAFEKIGFKNAIVVQVQPSETDFDTLDFGRASIRWMTNARTSFAAIGPRHVDPRTGEILDADIGIESLDSRNLRALRAQILEIPGAKDDNSVDANAEVVATDLALGRICSYAEHSSEQFNYALNVLEARGELDPADPEVQRFVEDYLKQLTLHEVGHTLGLRHNFRASRAYTEQQLADPAFTATHGTTSSVMEYLPINLRGPNESPTQYGKPFTTTIGPYDYWAIEYAYKSTAPSDEAAELARIASRSAEPLLAFGSDEDHLIGLDPETLQLDLGDDVLAFARKRIAIAQELLLRQETRQLRADQDYNSLRRSVIYAMRDVARVAAMLARQIGGVRTVRDGPGSGRDPLRPVSAHEQRQALALVADRLLATDGLQISPALQRRLAPDFLARWAAVRAGDKAIGTDFSLSSLVFNMQRKLLATLMSDRIAVRLLDSAEKSSAGPGAALPMSELYNTLTQAVWSELGGSSNISPRRRELQREHVNRLARQLLRPQSLRRADARGQLRTQATLLEVRIKTALRRSRLSADARAHLQDSASTLRQALTAKLVRAGT